MNSKFHHDILRNVLNPTRVTGFRTRIPTNQPQARIAKAITPGSQTLSEIEILRYNEILFGFLLLVPRQFFTRCPPPLLMTPPLRSLGAQMSGPIPSPFPYKESLMIVWSFLYYLFMRKKWGVSTMWPKLKWQSDILLIMHTWVMPWNYFIRNFWQIF